MFRLLSFVFSLSLWTFKIAYWVSLIRNYLPSAIAVKSEHYIFATALLEFWRILTLRDTGSGTTEKLDHENMGTAVGILLLCAVELEVRLRGGIIPRGKYSHTKG